LKRCIQSQSQSCDRKKVDRTTDAKHFSFNAPAGACRVVMGWGRRWFSTKDLVVPDLKNRWARSNSRGVAVAADGHVLQGLLRGIAAHYQQSLEKPYKDLPEDFKRVLLWGSARRKLNSHSGAGQNEQNQAAISKGLSPILSVCFRK